MSARGPVFEQQLKAWEIAGVCEAWEPKIKVFDGQWKDYVSSIKRYVGVPRMNAPLHYMRSSIEKDIVVGSTVAEIKKREGRWSIRSSESGWLDETFDAIVCSTPSPQALPLMSQHSSQLSVAINKSKMAPQWVLIAQYDSPLLLQYDAAVVSKGPLAWISQNDSKPARPPGQTLVIHASPEWSQRHLEESSDAVAEALIEAFVDIGGRRPERWWTHRWRYSVASAGLHIGSVWDGDQRLGLCGDWLADGTVEGAWLSGQSLASDIMHYQKRVC
jgi:renalase